MNNCNSSELIHRTDILILKNPKNSTVLERFNAPPKSTFSGSLSSFPAKVLVRADASLCYSNLTFFCSGVDGSASWRVWFCVRHRAVVRCMPIKRKSCFTQQILSPGRSANKIAVEILEVWLIRPFVRETCQGKGVCNSLSVLSFVEKHPKLTRLLPIPRWKGPNAASDDNPTVAITITWKKYDLHRICLRYFVER